MSKRPGIVALAASLALCTSGIAQQPLDLKVTAKKGSSVWLVDETTESKSLQSDDGEWETSQTTAVVLHMTVEDLDEKGRLVVKTRIARIHGGMSLPNAEVDFDSAAPADEDEDADADDGSGITLGGLRKALLVGAGRTFTAVVDPRGAVVELQDDAKELVAEADATARRGLPVTLTRSALKDFVRRAFGELPDAPVAVGGAWQPAATNAPAFGPTPLARRLTLAKADAGTIEIAIAGDGAEQAPADDGQTVTIRAKNGPRLKAGSVRGVCRISRADGFVAAAEETTKAEYEDMPTSAGTGTLSLTVRRTQKRADADAAVLKPAAAKPAAGGDKK